MKLIILKAHLKQGFSFIERSITENQNLPIIKNVLIKADTKVSLLGTNLEVGVTYTASAKILEPGTICVPFAPLHTIIQNSTSERINLESSGNLLVVKTDNYEAKLQGVPAEEFPIIPTIENSANNFETAGEVLAGVLSQVGVAAATNDIKPELNSVLFDVQVDSLVCAATDGFRLAEKRFPQNTISLKIEEPLKALVPLKTALEIARIFSASDRVQVFFDEHQVMVKDEHTTLISRLIDGSYPEYHAIIPKEVPQEIVVSKEEFSSAVKLVSNFSGKSSDIKLKFSSQESIDLFAANQAVGENVYKVETKKQKGSAVKEVVFNWRYFFDGVRAAEGEAISIGFTGEMKPVTVKSASDPSFLYIVMPVQQ